MQRSSRVYLVHSRRPECAFRRRPEVEQAPVDDIGAEGTRERLSHLRPDLVAARPDRGSDAGASAAAESVDRTCDDAREQTAPAGVDDGGRRGVAVRADERDRQAVGGEGEDRQVGLVRPEPVARLAAHARARRGARASSGSGG